MAAEAVADGALSELTIVPKAATAAMSQAEQEQQQVSGATKLSYS